MKRRLSIALKQQFTVIEHNEVLGISSDPYDAECRVLLDRVESWHEVKHQDGSVSTAVTMFSGDIYVLKMSIHSFDKVMIKNANVNLLSNG